MEASVKVERNKSYRKREIATANLLSNANKLSF